MQLIVKYVYQLWLALKVTTIVQFVVMNVLKLACSVCVRWYGQVNFPGCIAKYVRKFVTGAQSNAHSMIRNTANGARNHVFAVLRNAEKYLTNPILSKKK